MIRDITIGQYFPGKSAIHKMDPRIKILLSVLYIVMLFVADNMWGLLLGVLFWAAHILAVDRLVGDVSVLRFSSWQFLVTGVLNLAAGLVVERGEVTAEGFRGAFGAILFCGILSVGVGFTFQILGQKHASNPTFAAIILSSESVFSIIGALLWNRFTPESLHVSQDIQPLGYVGCACILVAIVLSQLNFRSRAKTVAHSSTVHHAGK